MKEDIDIMMGAVVGLITGTIGIAAGIPMGPGIIIIGVVMAVCIKFWYGRSLATLKKEIARLEEELT